MKEWEPFFAVVAVVLFVVFSISDVEKSLRKRIEELHQKVDALQETLDGMEQKIEDIKG